MAMVNVDSSTVAAYQVTQRQMAVNLQTKPNNRVNSRNGSDLWRQDHKYCDIDYYYYVNIGKHVLINKQFEVSFHFRLLILF